MNGLASLKRIMDAFVLEDIAPKDGVCAGLLLLLWECGEFEVASAVGWKCEYLAVARRRGGYRSGCECGSNGTVIILILLSICLKFDGFSINVS